MRSIVRTCCFIFLTLFPARQECLAQAFEYKITKYTETNGLSSRIIKCMLQDSRGMMWFGTPDGLNVFDGQTFQVFRKTPASSNSIGGNFVTYLAEGRDGKIWIGLMYNGVSCYDPGTGKFKHYTLRGKNDRRAGEVTCIFADENNRVWIGCSGEGIGWLDQKTGSYTRYNLSSPANPSVRLKTTIYNTVYSVIQEGDRFWLATHSGLYVFNRRSGIATAEIAPLPVKPVIDNVFGHLKRDGDRIWITSWAGGLLCFNTQTKIWKRHYPDADEVGFSKNIMTSMLNQGNDTLWVNDFNHGLGYFNKQTEKFTFLRDIDAGDSGFPPGQYFGFYRDRTGNFWVFYENGLMKIWPRRKKFHFTSVPVTTFSYPQYFVSAWLETGDLRLTGTWAGDGLQVQNLKTGKRKTLVFDVMPGEDNSLFVTDLLQDASGKIWVLTRDYLYHFDKKTMSLVKPQQPPQRRDLRPSSFLIAATLDDAQNLWIATGRNGVFVYLANQEGYIHYHENSPGKLRIPGNLVRTITKDHLSRVWIGCENGSLAWAPHAGDAFKTVGQKHPDAEVGSVKSLDASREGDLWVGTNAGLFKYDVREKSPRLKKVYTASEGIRSDMVYDIGIDNQDHIWCLTQTALCMLDPETDRIYQYGPDDGLKKVDIGERLITTAKGEMLLTTNAGYYYIDPYHQSAHASASPMLITSFRVNNEQRYLGNTLKNKPEISLQPWENDFSFEFIRIDFNHPNKQRYLYKLEGVDKDWVRSETRRYAAYTNIPGGNYVFKVRGEEFCDAEITVPVHIDTHYYATWWFQVLVALASAGGILLLYRNRIRQRENVYSLLNKANSLEKEKAMAMYEALKQQLNPHFLFNSLTSLDSLIFTDQKLASKFLEGLSRTYRYILKNRDNELVPLPEEVRFAEEYIGLQKARFEEGLIVTIEAGAQPEQFRIAPVTLQNLIENAIKHNIIADDSPLIINIYTEGNSLIVRNTLQKKKFVETSNGHGLNKMESFYRFLSDRPVEIVETDAHFIVKIPLIRA